MKLIKPSAKYQQSYLDYIHELGEEERYPFPLDFDHSDFNAMLEKIEDFANGRNLPEGYVPSTTLWLIEQDEIIGVTNLRHYLNQQIEHCGGHIGLSIKPSFRGKGYGNVLMKLSINALQQMGLSKLHIHCYQANQASAKAIESNGGQLESVVEVNNIQVSRYIVELNNN